MAESENIAARKNEREATPMDEFFAEWRNLICPICSTPLDFQFKSPVVLWCASCRKWFDGDLKRL